MVSGDGAAYLAYLLTHCPNLHRRVFWFFVSLTQIMIASFNPLPKVRHSFNSFNLIIAWTFLFTAIWLTENYSTSKNK